MKKNAMQVKRTRWILCSPFFVKAFDKQYAKNAKGHGATRTKYKMADEVKTFDIFARSLGKVFSIEPWKLCRNIEEIMFGLFFHVSLLGFLVGGSRFRQSAATQNYAVWIHKCSKRYCNYKESSLRSI
jgi:hypothetical protein